MRAWQLAKEALHGVRRAPLRAALTALGIAIATGALVSMVAFALGMQERAEEPFRQLGLLSDIEIRTKGDKILDDDVMEDIETWDGVDFVYPDVHLAEVRVSANDGEKCSSYAAALPREATFGGLFSELLAAGDFFSMSREREAMPGVRLVEKLGFGSPEEAVGQTLTIHARGVGEGSGEGNSLKIEEATVEVIIVGVYEPPSLAFEVGVDGILLPVDVLKDLPGAKMPIDQLLHPGRQDGYEKAIVRCESPTVVMDVRKALDAQGFETDARLDRLEGMRKFFVFLKFLLFSVGTVAIVVAGLGILNTLLMSVLERYREIGVYKALGASDGDVRILFLVEAALVGLVGGLGGLVLAKAVTALLRVAAYHFARQNDVDASMLLFTFPMWLYTGAVGFAIVASIVSGLYPASRAARIDPIRALRHE